MTQTIEGSRSPSRGILWTARVLGGLVVALFILITVSDLLSPERAFPTPLEWFQLSFFPIGLCIGYVVAWRWHLAGGVISLACMVAFFVVMSASGSPVHGVAAFYPFAVPGLLFLLYSYLARGRRHAAPGPNGSEQG